MKIRQVVERASGPDCGKIGRVETEEIHARLAAEGYIGAHVKLGEAREPRERRQPTSANTAHVKGRNADPALTIKGVESKLFRDERVHHRGGNGPMRDQQLVPDLLHHPPPAT